MLKCKQIPELTSAMLDDQLSFYERWQVKLHLFICHRCRDYWRALLSTVTALGTYTDRASDEQVEQVVASVKSHSSSDPITPEK